MRDMKLRLALFALMIGNAQAANLSSIPDDHLQPVIAGFISCYGTLNALADTFYEDSMDGTAEFARSKARGSKFSAQWLMSMRDGATKNLGEYNQYVDSAAYGSYYEMTMALENNNKEMQSLMIDICHELNPMQVLIEQDIRKQLDVK